jgi:hypothetical protein
MEKIHLYQFLAVSVMVDVMKGDRHVAFLQEELFFFFRQIVLATTHMLQMLEHTVRLQNRPSAKELP